MKLTHWGMAMAAILAAADDSRADDFRVLLEKRTYSDGVGAKLHYRLLRPPKREGDAKYPLVVFLHGAGERGDDNDAQLAHGVREFARPQARQKYPCFLIAPQCPNGKRWVEVDWSSHSHTLPKQPSDPMRLTLELVESIQKEIPIDARRIYITGLSMGGYGVWDALARKPKLFAAAVPVCGGADLNTAKTVRDVPVWMFHGDQDSAVPVSRSRDMAAALKKAGGHPKYTEYRGVGHNCWDSAYQDSDMFAWLFAQKRN
jgi:predicted peptidase